MVDPYLSSFYSCISDCISKLPGIPPGIIRNLWCNVNGMLIVCFWKTCIVKCSILPTEVSYSNLFPVYFIPKASLPALSALVPDFQSFGASLCIYSSPTSVNENKRTPCVKCFTFITLHNYIDVPFTFATARTIIKPLTFCSFLGRLWNCPVRASQWNLRICTPSRRWNSVKLFVRLTVLFCRNSRSCFTVTPRNSAANVMGSSISCNLQLLWRLCHFSPNY